MNQMLKIHNLHVAIESQKVLHDISLAIRPNQVHAIMGPNGSGKSTLANTLAGHPAYEITKGKIILDDKDLTKDSPNKRSLAGLFLAFQQPQTIEGVEVFSLLRTIYNVHHKDQRLSPIEFKKYVTKEMKSLNINPKLIDRNLNDQFSGGEKKKIEILQMSILSPKYAILDEIDSGLDIDALKTVAQNIKRIQKRDKTGILIITHYQRLLDYIKPDFVHILYNGGIVKTGDHKLATDLESRGYEHIVSDTQ